MGGKTQETKQTATNTPAGLGQIQDIWDRVQQAAATPYSPYTGQMVAGLNPTQQAGIQGITNAQGAAQPYFAEATNLARTGAAPISPADIQRYQSPYTQSVVDAARANFQQDNAIQQNQLTGNAAAKGALGNSRVGVMQAELARQQRMAQDPVIAGLYSNAYTQALGAAQADRSAAMQGANAFGSLAPSIQNAQISGAQAQIGAGGLQHGVDQAQLSAAYQQYLQQQAFPYQQAGFLASAGLPAVGAMGGTTSGTTTTPGPNPLAQVAGIGLSAAMAYSDRRVKRNVRKIGETFDGQPIYSYTFGNSPKTEIGLMAQDVERHHPEAVGEVGGIKTVDYEAATNDAARKRRFASGGPVGFFDVPTYIPKFGPITGGSSPYGSPPSLPSIPKMQDDPMMSPGQMAGLSKGMRKGFDALGGMFGTEGGNYALNAAGGGFTTPAGFLAGGVKRGGRISRSYGGRVNDRLSRFHDTVGMIRQTLRRGGAVRGYADGGDVGFEDRFGAAYDFPPSAIDPASLQDSHFAQFGADPAALAPQGAEAIPMPMPRPASAPQSPFAAPPGMSAPPPSPYALPPQMVAMGDDPDALPPDAMAFSQPQPSPYALPSTMAPQAPPGAGAAPAEASKTMGGWNPLGLSEDARMALISAGLGMAASRSPFALSAIAEGGLHGVKTFETRKAQRAKIESEARKLAQEASKFALQHDETSRHHRETEGLTRSGQDFQRQRMDADLLRPIKLGTDALGREIYGIRDPKTGGFKIIDPATGQPKEGAPVIPPDRVSSAATPNDESAIPANAQLVSDQGGRNEDYLKELEKLDANLPPMIRKIANYEISPTTLSTKGGHRERILGMVARFAPDYDAAVYPARAAAIKEFTAGGNMSPAGQITAGNTAIQHLAQLAKYSEKLGGTNNAWILNKPLNWLNANAETWKNNPDLAAYKSALDRYAEEATKFYRGSGGSLADVKRTIENLSTAASPAARAAALAEEADLMQSKINALQDRWKIGLGGVGGLQAALKRAGVEDFPIIQGKSREAMESIRGLHERQGLPVSTEKPAADAKPRAPQRPSGVPEGSQYNAARKLWRDRSGQIYGADGKPQ